MRNLAIAALALFASATVSAQDLMTSQVPTNLNTTFQKAYPNATDVEWEMEGENYKVEFDMGQMDNEIWYSKDGNTIKTEMEITENELPAAVKKTAQIKYPKYKIDEVEMTEENGQKTYEVELEKWFEKDRSLVIAEDGTLINERS
ncbi:PepSY-like domain-containing protein [Maribacter sp. X9]|uniref:PepSY-like domain-containing protein n=1 Tax=Maribacter sp. X9 TaxID=3402159 RepID=UPI003AF360B8